MKKHWTIDEAPSWAEYCIRLQGDPSKLVGFYRTIEGGAEDLTMLMDTGEWGAVELVDITLC